MEHTGLGLMPESDEATGPLPDAAQAGEPQAAERLLPLVYAELRRLAASKLAREGPGQTLQATALVHEAWLKLNGGPEERRWHGRQHFFAAAAEAMRRILVDQARRKRALRHGGALERLSLEEIEVQAVSPNEDELLAVHEALDEFAARHPRKAELVKLRYFAGLSFPEAARVLGISEVTAKRDWAFARAWLYRKTAGGTGPAFAPA